LQGLSQGEGDQRGEKKEKEEGLKQKHVGEKLRRTSAYFRRELSKRRLRVSGEFSTNEGKGGEGKEMLEEG